MDEIIHLIDLKEMFCRLPRFQNVKCCLQKTVDSQWTAHGKQEPLMCYKLSKDKNAEPIVVPHFAKMQEIT